MTHEVTNQTPPLTGSNAWRGDPLLVQIAEDFSDPVRRDLDMLGRFVMSPEAQDLARLANTETPKLRTHDRQGRRADLVEYHPAYHALMRRAVAGGLHSSVWENGAEETGKRHQVRALRFYLTAQLEAGHLCPITMTSASLAALMASPKLFREWAPRITSRKYDQAQKPPVAKSGLTLGMGMTEKQGGTDLRANTTRAERAGNGFYRLNGHKWFMSAPMSDAFLVLAQVGEGLSCFLVPRILGDGTGNGFQFQRLKDKLGNRSNASSEVEFVNAIGEMVGNPGEGVKTIMDMVTLTRLDCAVASAALMRAGLAEAVHHSRHRLVCRHEAHRQAADAARPGRHGARRRGRDGAGHAAGALLRRGRARPHRGGLRPRHDARRRNTGSARSPRRCSTKSMECLGGNGYVEEGPLARYYREAPVNAIWEGSGNVMALDVLRVLGRAPQLFEDVLAGIDRDLGMSGAGTTGVLRAAMQVALSDEGSARILTEQLALAAAAAELRRMGGGPHRRRLHRDPARRPVARHLRHDRRAPRRAPHHRHALSGLRPFRR